MKDAAQSALFDAFLFLVIAIVASAAVLGYTALNLAEDEGLARAEALAYTEDVRVALLRSTLDEPWYRNETGGRVLLGRGTTVERFLLDEVQLLARGLAIEDFSETNALILERATALVRSPFGVGISCSLVSPETFAQLWLSDEVTPPADRFTASLSYDTVDGSEARIAVSLWYV